MNSGSGPDRIGIEVKVTDRCNQGCLHCVNDDRGPAGDDIDHRLFTRRLEELVFDEGGRDPKIKEVRITGGEPLLNLSGVTEIAESCTALGIKSGLNSNGLLLHAGDTLDRLGASGIRIVKVSLDSLNPGVFEKLRGRGGDLGDVLEGISLSVKAGFEVIVRFTVTTLNREELVPCYRFARESGASRFQVKPLIESGRGCLIGAGLSPSQLSQAFEALSRVAEPSSCIPEILCTPPGEAFGMAAKSCGSLDKIYISVNGDVCSCNFIPGRRIGSIKKMSLSEILETRAELEVFESIRSELVLAGCPRYCGWSGSLQ